MLTNTKNYSKPQEEFKRIFKGIAELHHMNSMKNLKPWTLESLKASNPSRESQGGDEDEDAEIWMMVMVMSPCPPPWSLEIPALENGKELVLPKIWNKEWCV